MFVFDEIEQIVLDGRSRARTIELAAHPDNPRPDLGDLTEMIQSMRSVGVVQPLVVTTREAHLAAYPDHASAIGDAGYVITAGHRRAAAAAQLRYTRCRSRSVRSCHTTGWISR